MPATPGPGDPLTAILAGAGAAILALQNGMSRMIRPIWIMAPTIARFIAVARDQVGGFYFKDEMERGMFEGYPVRMTQQIPTNLVMTTYTKASEIYFVDMADFVIADTYNVVVDASDVAAYNDGVRWSRPSSATSRCSASSPSTTATCAPSVARGAADAGLGLQRRSWGGWRALLDAAAQSYVVAGRRHQARSGDRRERAADAHRSAHNRRRHDVGRNEGEGCRAGTNPKPSRITFKQRTGITTPARSSLHDPPAKALIDAGVAEQADGADRRDEPAPPPMSRVVSDA